jgi:hypothetical protein
MNGEMPENEYTLRSEIESICMFCFATVRSRIPEQLRLAQDVHSQVCPARFSESSTQY